jgi:hypothetical protein
MKILTQNLSKKLINLILLAVVIAVSGCASSPKYVPHAFSHNGWYDDPVWAKQVDLLAYSYGDQYHMVRREVKSGEQTLGYSSGVNGSMPVGEFLYVKWRIKETGEVIEDKVDLRNRLPNNMFDHRITFVIDGKQLYIYLVTETAKPKDAPVLKTSWSRNNLTYEIYPNRTYKK